MELPYGVALFLCFFEFAWAHWAYWAHYGALICSWNAMLVSTLATDATTAMDASYIVVCKNKVFT